MAGPPPAGDPAPADGALPASALVGAAQRAFGVYLHVPFCAVRCGYCDFNTYTATELGGGASQAAYAGTAVRELDLAAGVLRRAGLPPRPASTVFIGGGTPTLLPGADLKLLLDSVRGTFGLARGAEVTVEANPDSVSEASLAELAAAGVTRVSFGMQSQVRHVLAVLDRTHDPLRIPDVVAWARAAGLAVSLDLIYGTPGESVGDWQRSLDAALACEPDHLSAYALIVEEGTRLAARVRRGELPMPDDDDLADKYELADDVAATAGLEWYEVSNWARRASAGSGVARPAPAAPPLPDPAPAAPPLPDPALADPALADPALADPALADPEPAPAEDGLLACRHNLAYWRNDDWWGVGPGAHSHVGGVRWWNVRHPSAYAERIEAGVSPAQAREVLDEGQRRFETILLRTRLHKGLRLKDVGLDGDPRVLLRDLLADHLLDPDQAGRGVVVLTRRGRLLADAVVRQLLEL